MAVQKVAPAPADAGAAFFVRINHSVGCFSDHVPAPGKSSDLLDPPGAGTAHMSNLFLKPLLSWLLRVKSLYSNFLTFFDMTYVFHFQIRHFIE
ncbi:hypothetical protein D3C74_264390 [compost metagenome]